MLIHLRFGTILTKVSKALDTLTILWNKYQNRCINGKLTFKNWWFFVGVYRKVANGISKFTTFGIQNLPNLASGLRSGLRESDDTDPRFQVLTIWWQPDYSMSSKVVKHRGKTSSLDPNETRPGPSRQANDYPFFQRSNAHKKKPGQ